MKNRKYFSRSSLLLLSLPLFVFLAACSEKETLPDHFVGYVEADLVYIAAPQSGWLEHLAVSEGDQVAPGDLLFELDKAQQQARVEAATSRLEQSDAQAKDLTSGSRPEEIAALQATLDETKTRLIYAEAEKNRWNALVISGAVSKSSAEKTQTDYEVALAQVKAAERAIRVAKLAGRSAAQEAAVSARKASDAELEQVKWELEQRNIKSQVSGKVESLIHHQGEFVTLGAPVLSLMPENELKIRFFVAQNKITQLAIGQSINVTADGLAQSIPAKITYIASETEFTPPVIYSKDSRKKLVFMVEAKIAADASLRPGLPVDITL